MAQVSFYCSNSHGLLLDQRVADVADLFEAREYATALVGSMMATGGLHDWRNCRLHVRDDVGKEIFVMPFWSILGRPALKQRPRAALTFGTWT